MVEKSANKTRKKILELIRALGRSEVSIRESWRSTVEEHREDLNDIKKTYRKGQNQLRKLVMGRQAGNISEEEFRRRIKELQDELTILEGKLLNLRIGKKFKLSEG